MFPCVQQNVVTDFSTVGIFAQIDLSQRDASNVGADFTSAPSVTVTLSAGDMFYLPAGWFHEVKSYDQDATSDSEASVSGHMALNYWYEIDACTIYGERGVKY